jgi:hypothetical protein
VQWAPTQRILNSFLVAFPYVVRVGNHLIGSDQALHFDAESIARRLQEPKIHAYVEAAGSDPAKLGQLLRQREIQVFGPESTRSSDVNTDLFPKDEFYLNRTKLSIH